MMIDPVALQIGSLAIRWYGIAYAVGLLICVGLLTGLNHNRKVFKSSEQIFDLAFWVFLLGVVGGGRLGYVLFYNLNYFLANPLKIPAIWEGGMSFHGGLIAGIAVGYFYTKKHKINFIKGLDLVMVPIPLALMFGRLANFVNRELVGRAIENPKWLWLGVDFGDGLLRYPSQLFAAGKDLILFCILLFIYRQKLKPGTLMAGFLTLYGFFRFIVGFFRAPDPQIGYLAGNLTLGQLFSLSMIVAGLILLIFKPKFDTMRG